MRLLHLYELQYMVKNMDREIKRFEIGNELYWFDGLFEGVRSDNRKMNAFYCGVTAAEGSPLVPSDRIEGQNPGAQLSHIWEYPINKAPK